MQLVIYYMRGLSSLATRLHLHADPGEALILNSRLTLGLTLVKQIWETKWGFPYNGGNDGEI